MLEDAPWGTWNMIARRFNKCLPLLAGLALLFAPVWASARSPLDNLTIITEDYPPFNFEQDGELKGISTEIIGELLEIGGSKKSIKDIQLVSWARGYNLARTEPNHALFSTTRTEQREPLFKWVGPFVPTIVGVIAKKERGFDISSVADLHKLRIGAVRDDIGHQLLTEAGMPKERLEAVQLNDQNYKKLFSDRIDAIAYETTVSNWHIKNMGADPDDFEVIYELKSAELYLALHKDTPDEIVTGLQKALDMIKKNGTYQAILKKYM